METIIGGVVTACITGAITLVGVFASNGKTQAILEERLDNYKRHTDETLKRLEQKQDRHNQVIERVYKVESDLKTAYQRIDDLREEIRSH